jgi:hypothetical protein
VSAAYRKIFELKHPLNKKKQQPTKFQVSLWKEGLPLDALPQQGTLDLHTQELNEWLG